MISRRTRVPRRIAPVSHALATGLGDIFGDGLSSVFVHGAAAFPEAPTHEGDTDIHVILLRTPTVGERRRVRILHRDLARLFPGVGDDLDIWYISAVEARRRRPPQHLLVPRNRDLSWALHRAHWLAGRYILLFGSPPEKFCEPPSWEELERALRHEFRYVQSLVARQRAPMYCILNLSRILYSMRTRDVAVSKDWTARWALRHLPPEFRPAVAAARRVYHGKAHRSDGTILRRDTRRFLEYAGSTIRGPTKAIDI